MAYEKRLCILKQVRKGFTADSGTLSGAIYAERLQEALTITPKIAGLAPLKEGRYALVAWVGGKSFCLELKGNEPLRVPEAPSLSNGFSALVCFVRGEAEPVAYGFCGGAPADYAALLGVFSEKKGGRKAPIPAPLPPNQIPVFPSPQVPLAPSIPVPGEEEDDEPFRDSAAAGYDDEAIATTDYFGGVWPGAENEGAAVQGEDEEGPQKDGSVACADEGDGAAFPFRLSRGGLTYYNEIAPQLRAAMNKYPRDERLKETFPHSEWVNAGSALLGVIYAEGTPRYLCVATENEPPENIKDAAMFVPTGCFSEEEGLFVVFQDADTGEYVKVENA